MSVTETLTFHRAILIRRRVDVFLAGGGPVGMAAAVTATRQGYFIARDTLMPGN